MCIRDRLYTAAINGVFAFLIVGGLLFTRNGVTSEFMLNLLFYIIIPPVISLTLTRIMYLSENELVVADALARVDSDVYKRQPQYRQIIRRLPEFEKADRFKMNIVNCAMLGAFILSMPQRLYFPD